MAEKKIDLSAGMIAKKPTHPAGEITAWDEKTSLPIVRRKEPADTGKPAASPEPQKPAKPAEDTAASGAQENGAGRTKSEPQQPEPKADKPAEKTTALAKGDSVQLPDGTKGRIAHVVDTRTVRVKTDDGRNLTVRQSALQAMDHVVVKQHIRRIPR